MFCFSHCVIYEGDITYLGLLTDIHTHKYLPGTHIFYNHHFKRTVAPDFLLFKKNLSSAFVAKVVKFYPNIHGDFYLEIYLCYSALGISVKSEKSYFLNFDRL